MMEVSVLRAVIHVYHGNDISFRTVGFHFPEQMVFLVKIGEHFLVVPDQYGQVVMAMTPETWSGEKLAHALQYIMASKIFSSRRHATEQERPPSPLGNHEVEKVVEGPSGLFPQNEEEDPSPFWRDTQLDRSLRRGLEDRDS